MRPRRVIRQSSIITSRYFIIPGDTAPGMRFTHQCEHWWVKQYLVSGSRPGFLEITGSRRSFPLQQKARRDFCCPVYAFALFSMMAACAAARRAIGTRNGEQLT